MKKNKKILALVLSMLMVFMAGCNDAPTENNGQNGNGEDVTVWSKPSYVSVMQMEKYDVSFKEQPKFDVSGGRGEFEASQIIITAGANDVKYYDIAVCDLTCGNDVIPADYVQVYNEKYVEVSTTPAELTTGLGWYPDALLPFDKAVEYRENNIKAGQNQGIYVEIFIPRNVNSGVYTGTFLLTVDNKTYDVPASVRVFDFEVSQESHLETDWIVNYVFFGELDTTSDIYNSYFEAVAQYRASTHAMSSGEKDADEWMQKVRKYTNPNLTDKYGKPLIAEKESYLAQINLPESYSANTGVDHDTFDTYISRVIASSVNDKYDYLAKCGTYMGFIDEPQYNNTWDKVKAVCKGFEDRKAFWADVIKNKDIEKINAVAKTNLTVEDFNGLGNEFITQLEKSMLLVGNYATIYPDERLDSSYTRQFCISLQTLFSEEMKNRVSKWTDKEISGNWWYSAGSGPYGNRIDSSRLEQRLAHWVTYDLDMQGYLIWEVAQYQSISWDSISRANVFQPCNPYVQANRIQNAVGDGYVFYPGKPYGIKGPVASMRAKQYRDSSEEYEYFYAIEKLYSQAGYSADSVLDKIFSTLYSGENVTDDYELFRLQREQIISLLLLAQKGVFITEYSELNAKAKLNVTINGTEKVVKVNGQSQSNTQSFSIEKDMRNANENLTFETSSGVTFILYTFGKATKVYGADSVIKEIRGGSFNDQTLEGFSAKKLNFTVGGEIPLSDQNFDVSYDADKTMINSQSGYMAISIYNPNDFDVIAECWFLGKDRRNTYVDGVTLKRGYNTFYVQRLDLAKWGMLRELTGVRIKFIPLNEVSEFSVYLMETNVVGGGLK